MKEQRFYNKPIGASKDISLAKIADTENSKVIVSKEEEDAFYFRALEQKHIHLNRAQIEAVRHVNGPLLTLAGAGSGKTSVLVCRTGYLIKVHQVPARNILLVTFTKKAAEEMKERIASLPGMSKQLVAQVQARTFHSFFLTLLKGKGYKQVILSNERYKQLIIKNILRGMGIEDTYQPETILAELSFYKMNLVNVEELPSKNELKKILLAYEEWKRENNQFDFDDILVESYRLLKNSPELLKSLQNRFRYIMVDEFQDTNLLQYELIKMIAKAHDNLFVVGDDDQTIYSFNGARNDFILNFEKEFSNTKVVTLDINYRSTNAIVGLGNQVIAKNKKRKVKILQATKESDWTPKFIRPGTTDEEAAWIVQDMKGKVAQGSHQFKDFAILHRTNNNSRAIFEQLALENIPFVDYSTGNQIFYEQWPVRTVISYFRLALDQRDFAAMEEILPTLYINRQKGIEHIREKDSNKAKKYPLIHLKTLPYLKGFQKEKVAERIRFVLKLVELEPLEAIKEIRSSFYDDFLDAEERQSVTTFKETIKEALDELEASAKRFTTIKDFMSFVDMMIQKHKEMKFLKQESGAEAVTLMTIHRSKGLEFPVVYLIGASDSILPHVTALEAGSMEDRNSDKANKEKVIHAIEEERRLCYVAITRAMNELYISSPGYYRGKKVDVSTFLLEAFGKEERQTNQPKVNKPDKQRLTNRDYQVTVLAWICTSESCNAWQRIVTHEEAELEQKNCPLCQTAMQKGAKEI